jgi:hypothetical protein
MLRRKYYPLNNAAKEIGCKVDDIIHAGANEDLPVFVLTSGAPVVGLIWDDDIEQYYQRNDPEYNYFTGLLRVVPRDLLKIEANSYPILLDFFYSPWDGFDKVRIENKNDYIFVGSEYGLYIMTEDIDRLRATYHIDSTTVMSESMTSKPESTPRDHVSDKLAYLNQAAQKFWANADRDDRTTHHTNNEVVAWLVSKGYSETLADKAATIIRPEWAATGRKPDK